tara:strand:+ start:229 stop:702 length:474 start_codon:yes stop_codon:yes gene_type:complete
MKILGFPIPDMIMKLCKPAQVYLILSLISFVFYVISMFDVHDKVLEAEPEGEGIHHYTAGGLLLNILFTIVWIYLLNYICQFKYGKRISWFIVLLPFFFMGLMLIGLLCAVSFIALQNTKNKELKKKLNNQNDNQNEKPKMMKQPVMRKEPVSELLR